MLPKNRDLKTTEKPLKKPFYLTFLKNAAALIVAVMVVTGTVLYKKVDTKPSVSASAGIDFGQKIIIDAGHGGFDGGAVSADGTVEKNINLEIAKKTANLLNLYGFSVVMTREDDSSTESISSGKISARKKDDMVNRLNLINSDNNAVCVSIHLNKFTTSAANGAQVFYGVKNEKSLDLATAIQESIKDNLQPRNERVVKKGTKSTYLLYNSEVPMVITECGFISNKSELDMLKTDEYQTKMALCICDGIIKYINNT